jgi:hypothetical protein
VSYYALFAWTRPHEFSKKLELLNNEHDLQESGSMVDADLVAASSGFKIKFIFS